MALSRQRLMTLAEDGAWRRVKELRKEIAELIETFPGITKRLDTEAAPASPKERAAIADAKGRKPKAGRGKRGGKWADPAYRRQYAKKYWRRKQAEKRAAAKQLSLVAVNQ